MDYRKLSDEEVGKFFLKPHDIGGWITTASGMTIPIPKKQWIASKIREVGQKAKEIGKRAKKRWKLTDHVGATKLAEVIDTIPDEEYGELILDYYEKEV